jgi:hypothetical protein
MRLKTKEAGKALSTTVVGAGAGYGIVAASGLTAAGAVGGGAGVGSAAGPVGAFIGGLAGLALFGVYRIFRHPNHDVPATEK